MLFHPSSFILYPLSFMKIALVHDWLNQLGGAEDVLETLHNMFPAAPVFTSIYDRARMPAAWQNWDIRGSWMDRLPAVYRKHQPYMPMFAATWANYQIPSEYDVIISNKSAFCIGTTSANPNARHICYCLTPTRFIYDFDSYAARERIPTLAKPILWLMNAVLRQWERRAAQRVTTFVAISREIQARIKTYYNRDSVVIYPPVDTRKFNQTIDPPVNPSAVAPFFIASRLLPYKRIDLAIETLGLLGLPLLIAGAGRDRERLDRLAAPFPHIKLLGRVSDQALSQLLNQCRAFIFPGLEDFGIAPIQAMACGKPVIAFAGGGALDTVIDGKTGILFQQQTRESLQKALHNFSEVRFAPVEIRAHAEKFSIAHFAQEMVKLIG